jgi:exonuclease SbcC
VRIHRLRIEGFGPFRDAQTIDFDAFAHDGIFLIGGRTGAGKSSILDAISFALYGGVPRYDEGEKRVRSDHSALDEPTRVTLEFSAAGRRLRVERVPSYERRKRSGSGTTVSPAEARLDELIGDEWVGIAARAVDVAAELSPVLGLTQAQFLQVILLAQGRFARFLHARNDERQALLQTLFDSRRFEEYEGELERRRKDAAERLALEDRTLGAQLDNAERLADDLFDPAVGGLEDRLERVRRASMRAAHDAEIAAADEQAAASRKDAADAALATLLREREIQTRRDRTRSSLAGLEGRSTEIAEMRRRIERARAAETVRAALETAEAASVIADAADVELRSTRAAWDDLGHPPADRDDLEARADALVAERGTWEHARRAEAEAAQRAQARATVSAALAALDSEVSGLERRRSELPDLIEQLAVSAAQADLHADEAPAARARVVAEGERVAAATEAETLGGVVLAAEERARLAGKALTAASAALDELRERRFRDHAGELAERLVDGEACEVCGATEHPAPASRRGEPVTDELIAGAEDAKRAAIEADALASAAVETARARRAEAQARSGGFTVADARAALDEARADVAAAAAADARRSELRAERERLAGELDPLAAQLAEMATARTAAVAEASAMDAAIERDRELVAEARGDHASVEERIASAEATIAAARALADAQRIAAEAADARRAADARLRARLADASFADATEARAALSAAAALSALDAAVSAYDAELVSLRQQLMELELEALPEAPIDTSDAETAARAASSEWRAAVASNTEAARRAVQLAEAGNAAVIAHEAIAELTAEASVIDRLANTVAGRAPNTRKMNLETFVLAAELEQIVAAANVRLEEMSSGRYLLQHTDALAHRGAASGLGIDVMDRHTGQSRPVHSLSGGETFLASLALALGLAEVVTARAGGVRLDTLFIDEGFGSLDGETLEVAMRTLDELRQGGRVVGIISHVDAMKDQIPARLLVEVTPEGPSVVRQDVGAPI